MLGFGPRVLSAIILFSAITAAQCAPSGVAGTVNICTPTANATEPATFSVQAAATPVAGRTISSMRLYVDSTSQYTTFAATLNTSVTLAAGTHNLVINAWDNTGAVYQAKESVTVQTTSNAPVLTSPANGSALQSSQTFQWKAVASANEYWIWIGTTAGGNDLYNQGQNLNTSATISGLPSSGGTVYLRLFALIGNNWYWNDYSFTAPSGGKSILTSPANGSTLSGATQTFAWSAVAGADAYDLWIGSTAGGNDIYDVNEGTSQSVTVQNLPINGQTLYVRLYTYVGGNWLYNDYTFTTASGKATMQSPANGATLGSSQAFYWSAVPGTSQYYIWIGTTQGASDVYNQSQGLNNSATITGLPTNGETLYLRLFTYINGNWLWNDYTYTAGNGTQSTVPNVYTYMYDNGRSGLNKNETTITPANVTALAKKGTWTLDASSFTQPLFVQSVSIGSGTYNVLFVGTENDTVYALDADHPGTVLWQKSLIPTGGAVGRSYACSGTTCDGRSSDLGGSIGITGTPVIDPGTNLLYVVGKTTENNNQVYRLHALDIRTGNDAMASAIIQGSVPGNAGESVNGVVTFSALTQNQRPGLLLANGVVYVMFASYSDYTPYHGWVIAYDASQLTYIDSWNSTPNTGGGGIWAAGAAPSADANGNIFFATANQMPYSSGFPNIPTEIPNSVVKLQIVNSKLTLSDYFVPYNTQCLTNDDLDLGSSMPVLLPDAFAGHNMAAVASKEGRIYLLDRDNLGKFHSGSDTQALDSKLFNALGACGSANFDASSPWRVYGTPAYWNGNIYFGSAFGPLRQYNITNATLNQVALGPYTYQANGQTGRGPLTVVSANGNSNAIVWTLENDLSGNGWLRAYDATNVGTQLFNVNFGPGGNFEIPMVVNGHVFFVSKNTVYSYGVN